MGTEFLGNAICTPPFQTHCGAPWITSSHLLPLGRKKWKRRWAAKPLRILLSLSAPGFLSWGIQTTPPKATMSAMAHIAFQSIGPPEDSSSSSGKNVIELKITFQSVRPRQTKVLPLARPTLHYRPSEDLPLCLVSCYVLCMECTFPSLDGFLGFKCQLKATPHRETSMTSSSQTSSSHGTCSLISYGILSFTLMLHWYV